MYVCGGRGRVLSRTRCVRVAALQSQQSKGRGVVPMLLLVRRGWGRRMDGGGNVKPLSIWRVVDSYEYVLRILGTG